MPNQNLRFPILRRLTVKGYALFPGKNREGLDHVFEPGVTIIAGINGIGKTTILNLIYRLLVGPWDPRGDNDVRLTRRDLTQDMSLDYFSKRDRGSSEDARASGEFHFGERSITITRRLRVCLGMKPDLVAGSKFSYEQATR